MRKHIFIVDDDLDHAESLAEILELQGHDVELAQSGESAIARFAEKDFDLVFMDVKLPVMNGVETFFAFRRLRPQAHVFMMTGYSVEQLVAEAIDNGALGVLYKPFSANDLLDAVAQVEPRGRILVADDNAILIDQVAPILSAAGYAVEIAHNSLDQLDCDQLSEIDCMIVDMDRSLLRGMELCVDFKDRLPSLPKLLILGSENDEKAAQFSLLTQGILIKPFDPQTLLHTLDHLLHPQEATPNAGSRALA
ncbi:response regulator [Beijerinckia indica]|uniref:Response regulator receiver protein n=1 Tax=Beijerinckia indica subsp. indica (strain ATCC 9039 / DSM 1715 / NCIMB 8712) TaxID=395963 RepID=B2IEA9_BEII9|nr:response regulator [Beijerinckia indica]ACB95507.1 response regulator receiver protein [Beijerinckia indica subsp. indica ATCC 9039]